jgi:formylglycine-generating enzyme required for sulfatase activity
MTMKTLAEKTTEMRPSRVQATRGRATLRRSLTAGWDWLGGSFALPALVALVLGGLAAQAAGPTVSNVRAAQRPGTTMVDVYYDVADPDSSALTVSVAVSPNGGASYFSPGASVSGAGTVLAPGSNKKLTWNAGVDLPAKLFSNVRVSVTASDDTAPAGMANIPAGSFQMGDSLDGNRYAQPVHTVYVSAFAMDKYPVTKALWDDVYNWAITHGYSFGYAGSGKAANHPVQTVAWYDCVKWCNARSEKAGLVPAYYTSAAQTTVYRAGWVKVQNDWVKWSSGYRLPTEAEWERAARGGASGQRFPWGNTITHSNANYFSDSSVPCDTSPTRGYHPTFATGSSPYTSPVDYFAPNGYGLYDMSGNVLQWCWNWSANYSAAPATDPRGPGGVLTYRVLRGGSWHDDAVSALCAYRLNWFPDSAYSYFGFRCVRGL